MLEVIFKEYKALKIYHSPRNYLYLAHVYCSYHEIREQSATKKTSPETSVPKTTDVAFASFYHGR